MEKTENLMSALLRELDRNREILTEYQRIGPEGVFGAAMIKQAINRGTAAIASGNVVEMLQAYESLKETS